MGRYSKGLDGQTALQPNRIYRLPIDLWSTAKVFNASHRVGVLITSSAVLESKDGKRKPVYEVHPMSFDPVKTLDQARPASQTIHLSVDYPSSITLPVVKA